MKNRTLALLLTGAFAVCVGLSLWLFLPRGEMLRAEVYSGGELAYVLDLSVDRQVTVTRRGHTNVITVRDGAVAVTCADCPDQYCVRRGFCSAGAEIVCLPNRLVIRFVGSGGPDSVAG